MLYRTMNRKALLLGGFFFVALSLGWSQTADSTRSATQLVQEAKTRSTEALRVEEAQKIVEAARNLYRLTQQAMYLLSEQLAQPALELLELIAHNADSLQRSQHTLQTFPIEVEITEVEGVQDTALIHKILAQAKEAFQKNDLVLARTLLQSLRNEIEMRTHYLPIVPFKNAINLAIQFLRSGNLSAAKAALQAALNAVEIRTMIIAKPLLEATLMIQDAKQYFRDHPQTAIQLLQAAQYKIQLAKALGYLPSEQTVRELLTEIHQLQEKIQKQTATLQQFQQLRTHIQQQQQHSVPPNK